MTLLENAAFRMRPYLEYAVCLPFHQIWNVFIFSKLVSM